MSPLLPLCQAILQWVFKPPNFEQVTVLVVLTKVEQVSFSRAPRNLACQGHQQWHSDWRVGEMQAFWPWLSGLTSCVSLLFRVIFQISPSYSSSSYHLNEISFCAFCDESLLKRRMSHLMRNVCDVSYVSQQSVTLTFYDVCVFESVTSFFRVCHSIGIAFFKATDFFYLVEKMMLIERFTLEMRSGRRRCCAWIQFLPLLFNPWRNSVSRMYGSKQRGNLLNYQRYSQLTKTYLIY